MTNQIFELYFPHARFRFLSNDEIHNIDVFEISTTYPNFTPLSAAQEKGILDYCKQSVADHEGYSIQGLIDFIPGFAELVGKAKDDGVTSKAFCSQGVIDALARGADLKILNQAQSGQIAPGYITWSPLVFAAEPLKLLSATAQQPGQPSFAQEAIKAAESVADAVREVSTSTLPKSS